jgi:ADP-ribose pyrophosphatase
MKIVFEGDRLLVIERGHWQYAERKKGKSAVAVIAETEDGRVLFTDQFRHPVQARVIDWPAGLVGDEDPNITAADTARKELEEETGYVCDSVELLTEGPTSPGITSERVSFFRAHGVKKKNDGGGVEGEDITVHAVPRAELRRWLIEQRESGALIDLKCWAGLYFLSSK